MDKKILSMFMEKFLFMSVHAHVYDVIFWRSIILIRIIIHLLVHYHISIKNICSTMFGHDVYSVKVTKEYTCVYYTCTPKTYFNKLELDNMKIIYLIIYKPWATENIVEFIKPMSNNYTSYIWIKCIPNVCSYFKYIELNCSIIQQKKRHAIYLTFIFLTYIRITVLSHL